ncbi:MAG TPA: hypothetical protein VGN34_01790, partial [Ktedonobacteraceae bacterium]
CHLSPRGTYTFKNLLCSGKASQFRSCLRHTADFSIPKIPDCFYVLIENRGKKRNKESTLSLNLVLTRTSMLGRFIAAYCCIQSSFL